MKYLTLASLPLLVGLVAFTASPINAEETIVRTTTYTTSDSAPVVTDPVPVVVSTPSSTVIREYSLAPSARYVVVDPLTGKTRGVFDPTTRMIDGQPLSFGMVFVDQGSGRMVASVDPSGRIVDVVVAPATESLVTSIDARILDLQNTVNRAIERGEISAAQGSALKARLDEVITLEARFKNSDGIFTFNEAFQVANALNSMNDEIVTVAHLPALTPLVGGRFVLNEGNLMLVNDYDFRRVTLERRIDDEYKAGRLSSKYVAELKKELNEIKSKQTKYMKNGELKASKAKEISVRLDKVATRMDRNVASINNKRAKIGIRVD
ncbi:hypothetical protein KA183_05540 [bacterium]|nr:hypothetical protein [bacterium]QQR56658.1 MAG: hypothetical protein IPG59_16870 [Candidatus Melainabacteria bacterium]